MLRGLLVLATLLTTGQPKLIKVAIIDTGLTKKVSKKLKLCKTGHFDFTKGKRGIGKDIHGHGSAVAEAISARIKHENYCLIIYKVFNNRTKTEYLWLANAIRGSIRNEVKIINYSISGTGSNVVEYKAMLQASNHGIKLVVAAGNDGKNFDFSECDIFPVCYNIKNLIPVGALSYLNRPLKFSNSGKRVKLWELGKHKSFRGTSIAAAIATGKIVNKATTSLGWKK